MNSDRRTFLTALASAGATLSLAGCSGDQSSSDSMETASDSMSTDSMGTETGSMGGESMDNESMDTEDGSMEGESSQARSTLSLSLSDLPDLSSGHYEGWAVVGDETVSTGTFGATESYTAQTDRDLSTAERVVVTIEPDDDPSPDTSGVAVLAGPVSEGTADLSFPVDLREASGSYILATPTDGPDTNETSGVWFLQGQPPEASLSLPSLPSGWTYEGWVVHDGMPISTGRFDDPAAADGSMAYAGTEASPPPFPGADLLRNAPMGTSFPTDLTDGETRVVVSVEPDIDGADPTGPAPFGIKPLAGAVPADATDHTSYDLERTDGPLPSGTATIQ